MRFSQEPLPADQDEAVRWLLSLVHAAETKTLRKLPTAAFLRGWHCIGFLYPGLHPDSALEHGVELSDDVEDVPDIRRIEPRLIAPRFVRSGWPVLLAPIADEAWRRLEAGELQDDQFYCSEAVIAGMCFRDPGLYRRIRQQRESVSI